MSHNGSHVLSGMLFSIDPRFEYQLVADASAFNAAPSGSQDNVDKAISEMRANALNLDRLPVEVSGSLAIVSVSGVIYKRRSFWRSSWLDLAETFAGLTESSSIENVLLKADTPGGIVDGLAEAYDELVKLAAVKNVETQVVGTLASAGYHLACATKRITAQRMDVIGSIGTRLALFDFSKAFEDAGIRRVEINTGWAKSIGAMGLEVTDRQIAFLQDFVDQLQTDFQKAVQTGRNFSDTEYQAVSDGRWWLADNALELGLIDGIATFDETVTRLAGAKRSPLFQGANMTKDSNQSEQTSAASDAQGQATPSNTTAQDPPAATGAAGQSADQSSESDSESEQALTFSQAEAKRFREHFGQQGLEWMVQGKTFEECQQLHTQQLQAENEQLRQKVQAAESLVGDGGEAAGEASAGNFGDGGESKAARSTVLPIRMAGK